MDFSVNFMERTTVVLKEAFLLKKYKAMPLALAILVGIFMLPVILASSVCALFVYVLGYLFSVVSLPVQNLYKILHQEGQSVKHGTQVVIYLVSWSMVFFGYAALSVFMITLTILYSLFSILTYLWTLGGFRFHVFAKDEDISVQVDSNYHVAIPAIFVCVMGILLLVVPMINTISFLIDIEMELSLELFTDVFKMMLHRTDNLRFLVSLLYSAVLFAPNPKKTEK